MNACMELVGFSTTNKVKNHYTIYMQNNIELKLQHDTWKTFQKVCLMILIYFIIHNIRIIYIIEKLLLGYNIYMIIKQNPVSSLW